METTAISSYIFTHSIITSITILPENIPVVEFRATGIVLQHLIVMFYYLLMFKVSNVFFNDSYVYSTVSVL